MDTAQIFNTILENSSEFSAILTQDNKFLYVSPSCNSLLGYSPGELEGTSLLELFHKEDLEKISTALKQETATSYKFTYRIKRKDGIYIWFETRNKIVNNPNLHEKPVILSISRDITDKKNSEELVKKFILAVENASDLIVMANAEGKIMYANPASENITGFTQYELVGKHADTVWVGENDQDYKDYLWKTLISKKKLVKAEVKNTRKNGENYITQAYVYPIMDEKGELSFFVGISRDITKEKELDMMKTDFISLASHQLRTPLTTVKWFVEALINGDFGLLQQNQQEQLKKIQQSNERMIDLVNGLLNITRVESGRIMIDPVSTDIQNLVKEVVLNYAKMIEGKKIEVKFDRNPKIGDLTIDIKLVQNVLENLISNSVKYTPEGGTITLEVYKDGTNIVTKVSDTGYGIPEHQTEKVFDKFFRADNVSKMVTEGTGLGLYLSKAIMEISGGKMWFESKENAGSSFYFSIPEKGMEAKEGEVSITLGNQHI